MQITRIGLWVEVLLFILLNRYNPCNPHSIRAIRVTKKARADARASKIGIWISNLLVGNYTVSSISFNSSTVISR